MLYLDIGAAALNIYTCDFTIRSELSVEVRDIKTSFVTRFVTRPDVKTRYLPEFLTWSLDYLPKIDGTRCLINRCLILTMLVKTQMVAISSITAPCIARALNRRGQQSRSV